MSFYWDSEGSRVGSILRGVYCPSLWGIIILPITSACMCVWAFVAVLIFWPLVFHVLYKPTNVYWDYRIIPRDWQGSEELPCLFLLFLQILTTDPWGSEGLWGCLLGLFRFVDPKLRPQAHRWLGQVRAASLCWGGAGNGLPGSRAARFRSAELALTFRWSHLLAVNAGLLSWPRLELEYLLGGALLYFFDAPL